MEKIITIIGIAMLIFAARGHYKLDTDANCKKASQGWRELRFIIVGISYGIGGLLIVSGLFLISLIK